METPVAFVVDELGPGLEIVVNFGILTGREATQAEVDRLARTLLPDADPLAIVAARRHEYAAGSETVVHQVVVQVGEGGESAAERLRAACEAWATDCAAERHLETLDL
jgi:hypothetical protein